MDDIIYKTKECMLILILIVFKDSILISYVVVHV